MPKNLAVCEQPASNHKMLLNWTLLDYSMIISKMNADRLFSKSNGETRLIIWQ